MLNVHEVFRSISGEVGEIPQGSITWFIRFQGCNLRCSWCDTERAQAVDVVGPMGWTTAGILTNMIPANSNVVLTGGEPYLQPTNELVDLVTFLQGKNCLVQIETNGSLPAVLPICHVMDYKTPSSNMTALMLDPNAFIWLPKGSWVKMVVKTVADIEAAVRIAHYIIQEKSAVKVAFSVESGEMVNQTIGFVNDTLPHLLPYIVFNIQLHKKLDLA